MMLLPWARCNAAALPSRCSAHTRCSVSHCPAGKIVSVETITGPKATGETCHIIIQVRAINYRLL